MDADHIDPLHHIGDKLLYENDRVRVWELSLEPGEESHRHQHPHDYLMICIEGDKVAGHAEPGQDLPYQTDERGYIDIPTYPGHTLFVEGGTVETAVNTGTERYRNILVELKDRSRA